MPLQKTRNTYNLPVLAGLVTSTVLDNHSHAGAYQGSIDLAVPVGTPVLAAAAGTVTRVRDDSDKYGNDIRYGQDVNYISVLHERGEVSEYLHLAKASTEVKAGDKVKAGQQIAKTGLSGYMTAPHLHFMVYRRANEPQGFQCMEVNFS